MSFDLITSELDNHSPGRPCGQMEANGVWGPGALPTELCMFVVTMCNAMHKGSGTLNAPVRS